MRLPMVLVAASLCLCLTHAARILSVIPTASRSHYLAASKFLLELARRGHEVVSISPYEERDAPDTFTWVQVEAKSMFHIMPELKDQVNHKLDFVAAQHRLWDFTNLYSERILQLPILKKFIEEDRSHFDLVIAEEFCMQVFYVFAHKYQAPLVLFSSFGKAHYISEYMGNSLEIATVPHEFLNLEDDMWFPNRVRNLFATVYDLLARRYYSLSHQNKLAKTAFGYLGDIPHVGDLESNASLILVNSHFSMGTVNPTLDSIVEIAGIHIDKVKPLSKELKDILDAATEGAVLFSLGSILDLSAQPEGFQRGVLAALGRLRRTVLVKWNGQAPPPISHPKVHALKWLPQNDILAHPNTAAFVTHGGLHSTLEAVHHGVPIVCTPFFGDQPSNCKKSVNMGIGLQVTNVTEEALYTAVHKILTDASYKTTAQAVSKRFSDRIVTPLDSAIYWIEYVLRHRGADFMKSPRRSMHWYQIYFVDFFAVFLVGFLVILKIISAMTGLLLERQNKSAVKKIKKK